MCKVWFADAKRRLFAAATRVTGDLPARADLAIRNMPSTERTASRKASCLRTLL